MNLDDEVERVFREAYGHAVATLVRTFGDITLAEDAVQDAFVAATDRWPRDGIPPNPVGWIVTTARNRAVDHLRRAARGRRLERQVATDLAVPEGGGAALVDDEPDIDDRLRLIFTCCHPALRMQSQVALTLRLLGGLSTAEVARSFLVTEPAMAKRLVRAKYKIKAANIPYRVPGASEMPARLQSVLLAVYLIRHQSDWLEAHTRLAKRIPDLRVLAFGLLAAPPALVFLRNRRRAAINANSVRLSSTQALLP